MSQQTTVGLVTAYSYDLDRKLTGVTDPKAQTTSFQYDAAGRLIQKNLPSDRVRYTYNDSGGLTSVEDNDSLVFRTYDLQNRLVLENLLRNTGTITIPRISPSPSATSVWTIVPSRLTGLR